jgi:hypothetical protein
MKALEAKLLFTIGIRRTKAPIVKIGDLYQSGIQPYGLSTLRQHRCHPHNVRAARGALAMVPGDVLATWLSIRQAAPPCEPDSADGRSCVDLPTSAVPRGDHDQRGSLCGTHRPRRSNISRTRKRVLLEKSASLITQHPHPVVLGAPRRFANILSYRGS